MIYIILGMHKSGTTLVSQILHHSGINMGEYVDGSGSYDQRGAKYKYERASTLRLNREILGLGPSRFLDFKAPDKLKITESQRARMRQIIQTCNNTYSEWGFKDPRTALDYPLWASELPDHKIIAVFRPVGELWPRFRYNGIRYYHTNPNRAWQLTRRWCEHNFNILTYLQNTKMEFLVLDYRELMTTDTEFERLQDFVGLKLSDQRKKDLYRSRSETLPLMKIAFWLVYKQTGCAPEIIIEQFEALRQKQMMKYYDV